ncbi:MAG: hypothetical protein ILO36_01415 [Abditibacteriota bacterium]|nr:hypothetical protein [Abditibacteriota bacterium]
MKTIKTVIVLLLLAVPAFAINSYVINYSVQGKRYTQTVNANSSFDAKKLIEAQNPGKKVFFTKVTQQKAAAPAPPSSRVKSYKPVYTVTFSMNGKRYQQAVRASGITDAKKQIQNMYPGRRIIFSTVKKQ